MTFILSGPLSYVLYMAAAAMLLSLAGAFVDDRYRVEPLIASLPIRRELMVTVRCLWCAVAIAFMLALTVGEVRVLAALSIQKSEADMPRTLGAPRTVLFLLATAVPLALFLPFQFSWGLGPGAARFSMVAAGLAVLGGGAALVARAAGVSPMALIAEFFGGATRPGRPFTPSDSQRARPIRLRAATPGLAPHARRRLCTPPSRRARAFQASAPPRHRRSRSG